MILLQYQLFAERLDISAVDLISSFSQDAQLSYVITYIPSVSSAQFGVQAKLKELLLTCIMISLLSCDQAKVKELLLLAEQIVTFQVAQFS